MGLFRRILTDRRGCAYHNEMMLPVAIIGILAAIAIPKFAELVRKSNEGSSKGNLGAIRSATAIAYGDLEGEYPEHPLFLTVSGRYLRELPPAKAPNYHRDSAAVRLALGRGDSDDAGGWLFVVDPEDPDYGMIFVNCTHTDTKGRQWLAY